MRRSISLVDALRRSWLPDRESLVSAAPPVPLRAILRRFWPYARPYRRYVLLGFVFVVVAPALEAASLWLFKLIVDEVLIPRDFDPFPWFAGALLGLTVLGGAIGYAESILSSWLSQRFVLDLRTSFFRHLHSLSLDFFERRRLGDVLTRLGDDVSSIESFVLSGMIRAVSNVVRLAVFTGLLFYLSWKLALVAFAVAPAFALVVVFFSKRLKHVSREKRRFSGAVGAVAEESLSNAAFVQAYNRTDAEVGRFEEESLSRFAAQLASTRLRAVYSPVVELVQATGALIVLGMGTWLLTRGELTVGGLLVFLGYLTQLYSPIRGMARLATSLYTASASAERVIEFLDERPAVVDRPGAPPLPRRRGLVEFDGVSFRYPTGVRDAVSDVSFRIGPGEVVALVGASGAGKSTLAKLLLRFVDPAAGAVRIDGHDLRDVSLTSVRDAIAAVFQETLVFDGTVAENIAMGRPGAGRAEIERAARLADADEFVRELSDGYDARIGQRGRRLSGGQRQRIAIARALVRDAPILVLDEPTTALDAEAAQRVLEPLRGLMQDRATLVISHSLLTVHEATTILVLEQGRVVERGSHVELLALDGRYAELHRLQLLADPARVP